MGITEINKRAKLISVRLLLNKALKVTIFIIENFFRGKKIQRPIGHHKILEDHSFKKNIRQSIKQS